MKDELVTEDWFVTLSEACLSELRGVVQHLRRKPVPLFLLSPDDFALDKCRETMNRVRRSLARQRLKMRLLYPEPGALTLLLRLVLERTVVDR